MTEHEIQKASINLLHDNGFVCCVTSNRKRTANTKGTPDVFVFVGGKKWIAIEFKSPCGKLSEEQKKLNERGAVYIIRSVEEAIKACWKELE
jgi:hypothetical protein